MFLLEPGGPEVRQALAAERLAATCRIAYAEAAAAFARASRERRIPPAGLTTLLTQLARKWPDLVAVDADQALVEAAAQLVVRYPLRGFDAVHLAAALAASGERPRAWRLATWDGRMWDAARALGFDMLPAARPAP